MRQLNLNLSAQARDEGIKQAADNADRHEPNWSEQALGFLGRFPATRFMAEDFRVWAEKNGLPAPPSGRAYGSVIVKAKRLKMIKSDGFGMVRNPKAHRTPASVWVKIQ